MMHSAAARLTRAALRPTDMNMQRAAGTKGEADIREQGDMHMQEH